MSASVLSLEQDELALAGAFCSLDPTHAAACGFAALAPPACARPHIKKMPRRLGALAAHAHALLPPPLATTVARPNKKMRSLRAHAVLEKEEIPSAGRALLEISIPKRPLWSSERRQAEPRRGVCVQWCEADAVELIRVVELMGGYHTVTGGGRRAGECLFSWKRCLAAANLCDPKTSTDLKDKWHKLVRRARADSAAAERITPPAAADEAAVCAFFKTREQAEAFQLSLSRSGFPWSRLVIT